MSTDTTVNQLLDYSYHNQLTHVPSALSMLTYVDLIFSDGYIKPHRDRIVLGKPFGSQAYYIVWKKLGYLDNIEQLSAGVKHSEIAFVDYGEETMGNALGVAIGIAIANRQQTVWVNISDATLQMGSTLEAIQYIGHRQLNNIWLTIDGNGMQVTGATSDVLTVTPVLTLLSEYGWNLQVKSGHDPLSISNSCINRDTTKPNAVYFKTIKGHGVDYMEDDPVKWHYRPIENLIIQ